MPEVDGIMATKAILGANNGKPLKVVGITSFETDEAIQRCLDSGMAAVISKPLDVMRLQSAF
eukprot:CAMPEP_0185576550 /NCGR_PEP_ID=MMETSP0434-20130131/7452_1 /TAXON_ID=626734 ORGANISM="Favella taraikaensis, Strain Fe Narragansett Bay" /NCGR_SAMPLE_ID=MMETSP0434 /ASSEMBLY_ACC=CAM_ASM_000379 /LENGTH=61 /DNA_ID=CAMNT_0028193801 /DNA_START=206 /DNA_END=391 /DNA_ORIENTATION=+